MSVPGGFLVIIQFFTVFTQGFACVLLDFLLQKRRPAEQQTADSERLPRPFPEVEGVRVTRDFSVLEFEFGVNTVKNLPAGFTEKIIRRPVRRAFRSVGADV